MELLIAADQRYERTPDGAVWTRMPPAADFWAAHCRRFSRVTVLARVREVASPPARSLRVDAPGVSICAAPDYQGFQGFLAALPRIWRIARRQLARRPVILLRVPSQLAYAVWWAAGWRVDGVEVLADPRSLYGPGAVGSGKWSFWRRALAAAGVDAHLHAICGRAKAAVAVSAALRGHYCRRGEVLVDLEVPATDLARVRSQPQGAALVSVGGFDHPVKGHDVLIEALARLPDPLRGAARLTIVGEGRLGPALEAQARRCGVHLQLPGAVGGPAAVRPFFDQADLFVLASRSEGQPRALIEAMAAGLPAVATAVGGTAELLDPDQLVPPDDPDALARAIARLLLCPDRYQTASQKGLLRAADFEACRQRARRAAFWEQMIAHQRRPTPRMVLDAG